MEMRINFIGLSVFSSATLWAMAFSYHSFGSFCVIYLTFTSNIYAILIVSNYLHIMYRERAYLSLYLCAMYAIFRCRIDVSRSNVNNHFVVVIMHRSQFVCFAWSHVMAKKDTNISECWVVRVISSECT